MPERLSRHKREEFETDPLPNAVGHVDRRGVHMGNRLMFGLAVFDLVLALVFAAERWWPTCADRLGAAMMTGSLLAMR